MKILYVAGVGKYGTFVLSRDIFRIWIKHGYEIVFAGPPPDKLLIEFAKINRIPMHYLALSKTYRLDEALKLAIIARRQNIDIIHACILPPGRFLCRVASLLSNIPLVVYIGTPAEVYNTHPLIRLIQKFLHRWTVATSQGIIAMTDYLAEQLRHDLRLPGNLKITVVAAGVNLSVIRKKSQLDYKNGAGMLGNSMRVVQVARLAPEKGQDIALRAVEYVLKKGYRISVDFIGGEDSSGYRSFLESLIPKQDFGPFAFNFLGYLAIEQIYENLAEYDLFLHPSRSEGQGIAVLEAMAAGLPVVASKVGGLNDLVAQQITGLLVPKEDHVALAEAIIWLIQNPSKRIEMGEMGYKRAKDFFSLEATESKMINFYENLRNKYCA
jgi:glycosyltransferase involved in cell wall biosynthesis